tara:strand:+ start:248 stop:454 length:207 start_codon:yes stop_codon:yes gene_type:complete
MSFKIETFQKTSNRKVASCQINSTIYEIMIRCAELNGYETVSGFVKDAILDKCKREIASTAAVLDESF